MAERSAASSSTTRTRFGIGVSSQALLRRRRGSRGRPVLRAGGARLGEGRLVVASPERDAVLLQACRVLREGGIRRVGARRSTTPTPTGKAPGRQLAAARGERLPLRGRQV